MANRLLNIYNPNNYSSLPANSIPYALPQKLDKETLPNGGGTFVPGGSVGPVINKTPIFTGSSAPKPTPTPTAPIAPTAPERTSAFYDKYKDPATGKVMTPEEYGIYLGNKVPKGNGEISNYAGNAATNPNQSAVDLTNTARNLNNSRNDLAVGETDPYKVGSQSGIAYSPAQLRAIENAYAGIYDPALNDVFTRLQEKKAEDEKALARANMLEEAALARTAMLEEKALDHKYRMAEKVSTGGSGSGLIGPSSYQEWVLSGEQQGTGKTYYEYLQGKTAGPSFKSEIATTGREAVSNMKALAEANPGIFGRSALVPIPESMRSDAFRDYSAQLDSLKGNIIPAALTAMREASATGGALGQVSDREGDWLSSSLGALQMSQSPAQVLKQLDQIDKHLATWQDAVEANSSSGQASTNGELPSSMELNGQILHLQSDGTYL